MEASFAAAAKCFSVNKDDVEICLRAVGKVCEVTRAPRECAREFERLAEERTIVELVRRSEDAMRRDFEAFCPFSWY
jgi:hypothetical protein